MPLLIAVLLLRMFPGVARIFVQLVGLLILFALVSCLFH